MKSKTSLLRKAFGTKSLQVTTSVVLCLAISNHLYAQCSYAGNSVPIGGAGAYNCAFGYASLTALTTGQSNVAVGTGTLQLTTTGTGNVALGSDCMYQNVNGNYNIAVGTGSLDDNTSGSYNVADGGQALASNTTGSENVSSGYQSTYSNTTGIQNTAVGTYALYTNVSGSYNSVMGRQALSFSTTANFNVSNGFKSLYSTTTGDGNTGIGSYALYANTTGTYNTGLGYSANLSTGNLTNATVIGNTAVVNASNKVRVGNASVTVIEGQVPFTSVSDGRFKTNIVEDDVKGLEFIKKLRPVVYNLDTKKLTAFLTKNMPDSISKTYMEQDFTQSTSIRQSGFIAQEVEAAAKEVNYNFNGVHKPADENDNYGLAYSQFVVPLVKAVQEQQKIIENLQQQISELKNQGTTTGIGQIAIDGSFMDQNVPNPFSGETVIKFNLASQFSTAYMGIYDLSGKQLKTIAITERGASSIKLTADQLAPGMYIYSIMVDGKLLDSKRMIVSGK